MADWQKIKTEYITTDTSYRKLAEKHGVGESTLFARASKERWVEQKEQHQSKTVAKTLDAISNKQVDRTTKLISVADLLLEQVKSIVESKPELLANTQSMKNLSGVLKDIKEIQMIKSDADMREQEARIRKLQKEAEQEDTNTEVVITFGSGGKKEWAE